MLTFTLDEFLAVVTSYNLSCWHMALAAYILGIGAVIFAFSKSRQAGRTVVGILVLYWLWTGIVFNGLVFTRLERVAVIFAVLFVIQAVLLAVTGMIKDRLSFSFSADWYGWVGIFVVLFSMLGYPLIETLLGRGYPQLLLLGLSPCPTVVFTLGLLLWSRRPLPKIVLVIPVLYAVFGGAMAASRGIVEDLGMVLIGLVAGGLILYRDRRAAQTLGLDSAGTA